MTVPGPEEARQAKAALSSAPGQLLPQPPCRHAPPLLPIPGAAGSCLHGGAGKEKLALLLLIQQLCTVTVTGSRAQPGALAPGRWLQEGARHAVSLEDLPALLPTQVSPALPRGQAGRRYPGLFCNCTRSSVGCHNKNFLWLGILKRKEKSLSRNKQTVRELVPLVTVKAAPRKSQTCKENAPHL